MTRLVNPYTVDPTDIEVGDMMLSVVKAQVIRPGFYRLYCCCHHFYFAGSGISEGCRVISEREVCQALFPSLAMVAEPDGT